ncbi:MAG: glutaredoxin [Euryarchaeota archaeon]|jgi:glutaredoxin|nr:glutaredoxin [Euryarchaeota archaeon]|tara:strand:- start:1033 stop:1302 length:270 start_codon:yes stop_codon:yes gene_type:complete
MEVVVYSRDNCVFCDKAKSLLQVKEIAYTEEIVGIDISKDELFKKLGKEVRSVPQIVVDKTLIGGYNELTEYLAEKENYDRSEQNTTNA